MLHKNYINKEIIVSIICNTYNHENYIKDALDGFLMQKTEFKYEVLVHDDASTDKTPDIIKEYEKKYPDIIRPIYQKENQYSKGISIGRTFQYPRVRGKYVAICEGDDYWTDPNKLQKQFDIMEQYSEVDMCAHYAKVIDAKSGRIIGSCGPKSENRILSVRELMMGGGAYVATASLFGRKDVWLKPLEFRKIYDLDYTLQISGALRGGMYYLKDEMSVYRSAVNGCWTQRMASDVNLKVEHKKKILKMIRQLDVDTKGKYRLLLTFDYLLNTAKLVYFLFLKYAKFIIRE